MRTTILIASLLMSSIGLGQYSWTDAVVTLKNGTVLNGEAKVPQVGASFNLGTEKLKFRTDRKAKNKKYKIQQVKSVVFTVNYKERVNGTRLEKTRIDTYVPVLLKKKKNKSSLGFMQEVVVGNVNLYGRTVTQYTGSTAMAGVGGTVTPLFIPNWHSHNQLWVARGSQEAQLINHASLFKGFKKRASEYFEDCPKLIQKLENRELKKSDLKEIVELYNADCD